MEFRKRTAHTTLRTNICLLLLPPLSLCCVLPMIAAIYPIISTRTFVNVFEMFAFSINIIWDVRDDRHWLHRSTWSSAAHDRRTTYYYYLLSIYYYYVCLSVCSSFVVYTQLERKHKRANSFYLRVVACVQRSHIIFLIVAVLLWVFNTSNGTTTTKLWMFYVKEAIDCETICVDLPDHSATHIWPSNRRKRGRNEWILKFCWKLNVK